MTHPLTISAEFAILVLTICRVRCCVFRIPHGAKPPNDACSNNMQQPTEPPDGNAMSCLTAQIEEHDHDPSPMVVSLEGNDGPPIMLKGSGIDE